MDKDTKRRCLEITSQIEEEGIVSIEYSVRCVMKGCSAIMAHNGGRISLARWWLFAKQCRESDQRFGHLKANTSAVGYVLISMVLIRC